MVSPRGRRHEDARTGAESYEPEAIVARGSYDEILDEFERRMWSDGLPIVPPTLARVRRMLAHTSRDPAEIIGIVGDESIEATVWNVAVNAVVAGCRDRDLPIVLAVAEAISAESFRLRDAGSTTSWEILVVLSGPDLPERGFNTETAVTRIGHRPNTSIGRFTRLWTRNIAGVLPPPGFTDMAAIGQSFHVAMAESDQAVDEIGWPTAREEWGYQADDLVVSVQGVVSVSAPIYTAGDQPESHLALLAENIAGCSGHFSGNGAQSGRWTPLLAMNPPIAAVFARHGLSKDDVRAELAARAQVPARWLVDSTVALGFSELDLARRVAAGQLPPEFSESDAPDRLVPVILDPAALAIIVTGNPGRNQSKFYTPLGLPGQRVTRRVES